MGYFMEVITDTSAIVAVILNEPEKERIISQTAGYREIIAPESVIYEVGNAFSAMLKRNRLDIDSVTKAAGVFNKMPLKFVRPDLKNALKISASHNIYAYDAYIIECSLRYEKPLITLDKRLAAIAGSYHIDVLEVRT